MVEVFKMLRPLGDIASYRFDDWRTPAVVLEGKRCYPAVFSKAGEAYLVLANFSGQARTVTCSVRADKLPEPLAGIGSAEIVLPGPSRALSVERLTGAGESIALPADGAVLIRLK